MAQTSHSDNVWGDLPLFPSHLPLPPPLPLLQEVSPVGAELLTQQFSMSIPIRRKLRRLLWEMPSRLFDTINVSPDEYEIGGPEVGSQFDIEMLGTIAEATKRAQNIFSSVKKDDDTS